MKELKINGVSYAANIHQDQASLPYLLMLHGFMGDSRCFEHLIEGLCNTCNPVAIDLLGHGNTEKIDEPERYHEGKQIKDVLSLINKLLSPPLYLYGYSMGGRLALKTVGKEPDLFKGLILESTSYGIVDENKRDERKETDNFRALEIEKNFKEFLDKWEELPLFQSPIISDENLVAKYIRIHSEQDPDSLAASLRGFGTGNMTPLNKHRNKFSGPVLLLAGSGDEKYIGINKNLEQFFEQAKTRILAAGHRVHLDNPGELTKEIKLFIQHNT